MTKRRLRLLRALLVLSGISLAGGAFELFFRATGTVPIEQNPVRGYHIADETLGWIGRPGHVARFRRAEFDITIATSESGFRRAEVESEAGTDAPTTIFLGDSFTWGWGVAQGEVFTDRLQAMLPKERIENRGINGIGTAQQRHLLDRVLETEKPDRIVVMFFANDPRESIDEYDGKRPAFALVDGELEPRNVPVRNPISSSWPLWCNNSIVLTSLRSALVDLKQTVRAKEPIDWLERNREGILPEGWDVCRALLVDMRDRCREAGVDFRIAFIPVAYEITVADRVTQPLRSEVQALCATESIPLLDLALPFHEAWKENESGTPEGLPYYFPQDQHWTATGHDLAARELSKWWNE